MRVSSIRFTGLASGLDTESMVKAMMMPHQAKIDTQKQNQTLINWKKDAWKDINNQVNTFYTKYIDKLRLSSTFMQNKINISNNNALDVDSSSKIPQGSHTVEINQLATGAYMQNGQMTGTSNITSDTKLSDLGITGTSKIRVEKRDAEGKTIGDPIDIEISDTDTIDQINQKLQAEGTGASLTVTDNKLTMSVNGTGAETVSFQVVSNNPDPDGEFMGDAQFFSKLGFSDKSIELKEGAKEESKDFGVINKDTRLSLMGITAGTITVGNKPIDLSKIDTIGQLESEIKKADENLNVNFDEDNQRFFISSKLTGSAAKIDIKIQSGAPLIDDTVLAEKLGLKHTGSPDTLNGKPAEYKYNGMSFTSDSNVVTVNGIKMTLKDTTTAPIQISATPDTEKVVDFVKEFVDEYNKLIDDINKKIGAKKNYNYDPLTEEQKKDMTEDDIRNWENKIKEGMFSGDSQLENITDVLRGNMGAVVEGGSVTVLSQIGITTGNWEERGKLHFDEDKFTKALENDPEGIINLFAGKGDESAAKELYLSKNPGGDYESLSKEEKDKYLNSTKGIATKLYDDFTQLIKSSQNKSYGTFYNDKVLDERLKDTQDNIYKLEQRYVDLENSYYAKFAAMEKMMSQVNNQSSWLSAQLGGM